MSSIIELRSSKVVAAFVGIAMMFTLLAFAPSANAQSADELAAQIADLLATISNLQAQLNSMTGGSTTTACTFTRSLSDGVSGADVTCLQNYLTGTGHFTFSGGSTGYFGPITTASVAAWQAANGVAPAVGYFGPISQAKYSAVAGTVPTPTPGVPTPTPGVPTPTPGAGTEGSLTVTRESSPSNGTDVEKGQTKNIAAIKIQADSSDLTINRVDVNFSVRPWLYLSSIAILDGSTVVKEISGLSSSNFIEVTEGSDYRLRVSGLNVVVAEGTKKVLTARVTALSSTDKTAVTVTTTFKANAVRATDTSGLQHEEPATALTGTTWDFKVNTTGDVVATLDANSPEVRNVIVTTTGVTPLVELMRFELEAKHSQIDVNSLQFTLANSTGNAFSAMFNDVWLADSSGNSIASASTVATTTIFSTADLDGSSAMVIPVTSKKSYRLMATVADADDFDNGTAASTTLTANTTNIVAEDAVFNTATVNTASTVTGADVHFYATAAEFTASSASVPSIVATYLANVEMKFTLTAKGGDIFVSKTPGIFIATSTTASGTVTAEGGGAMQTALTSIVAGGSTAGDSTSSYKINSGASRTFTFAGSMNNLNGTSGSKEFKITGITWAPTTEATASSTTTFGLENLEVNPSLGATAI